MAGGAWADETIKTDLLLRTATTLNIGQPIVYPRHGMPEISTMIVTISPGGATGPAQPHPVPVIACILEGQAQSRVAGGTVNRYKAGDSFVEALNRPHAGTNIGSGPLRILVTVIGRQRMCSYASQ